MVLKSRQMSNNNNKKILNVPALRFPEFDGEWKVAFLGDVSFYVNARIPTEKMDPKSYISTENMRQNYSGIAEASSIPIKSSVIAYNPGDVLISNIRPYLKKSWLATYSGGCSSDVLVVRSKTCLPKFLFYILSSDKFINYVMNGAKGVKMPRGDKKQIMKYEFHIPSMTEQNKITDLLSLIDKRIEIQNAIIDDLKKLRSSVIREVFCAPGDKFPQARFPGFFKEWQLVRLSDVATRISQRNDDCKCSKVLTIAAQEGLISQENFFSQRVASTNLQNYILLSKGDFAYNKSYSNGYPYGAIKRLKLYSQGIVSPIYLCFRLKSGCDSDFISYYFESTRWYRTIAEIAGEGARNHGLLNIAQNNFFNILLRLPDIKEQQLVASFIALIESKINHESIVCNAYINQKKWVLKRMFI
jgi:type I restriction enzyme S subunit